MEDESASAPKRIKTERYKCAACYKMYNKMEHLVEHMKVSYHSVHEPSCGVCKKHCRSFESLREHLIGPLPKSSCAEIFVTQGCNLCMNIFDSSDALSAHKEICCLSPTTPLGPGMIPLIESKVEVSNLSDDAIQVPKVIAIDCEMVGGGWEGTLDLCASVCLIDESENVLFHTYVQPILPVTNYRYDITGLTEEHLKDAMPLEEVQEKILKILRNGETISKLSLEGGKGRLLVGHSLKNDLECLRICYPDHMLRDTAMYRPLMKTNLASHSLKYLTKTYLGYEIQSGIHDPFEDGVAAMRLYKRMRAQDHPVEQITLSNMRN
ncbi:hypothetical protein AQUCO_01700403v1 [Aquilegia coerulea]|uniref:RNA exonuclease 4 n=1 Tax=Aquilegia coerulea TaxID=218851 RepID=A0A2G5DMP4_AQUCA|nr:hypothetical protein AQUCO_01700403v1 [Aquilegia coerulea]